MQESKTISSLSVMIPAFVSMPGVRARPSFRLQCLKKTVDRRGRRVADRDYRTGQVLFFRRLTL
jgi:hypothetical protein